MKSPPGAYVRVHAWQTADGELRAEAMCNGSVVAKFAMPANEVQDYDHRDEVAQLAARAFDAGCAFVRACPQAFDYDPGGIPSTNITVNVEARNPDRWMAELDRRAQRAHEQRPTFSRLGEPSTSDYCARCGDSPESGSHLPHGHEYQDPRHCPSVNTSPGGYRCSLVTGHGGRHFNVASRVEWGATSARLPVGPNLCDSCAVTGGDPRGWSNCGACRRLNGL